MPAPRYAESHRRLEAVAGLQTPFDPLDVAAADPCILEFIDSDTAIGWSVIAPPGVPPDRVAALREAFDQMVKDPKFLADAEVRHLGVVPSTGQEIEALIKHTLSIPKEDVATMNKLLATKK